MNKICNKCGYNGENMWRDGKYYCAACGSEVDVTQQDSNTNRGSSTEIPINAVCPICKNANNNTLKNGKCYCSLCGTPFDFNQPRYNTMFDEDNIINNYKAERYKAERIAELEKQKNNKMLWGILFVFVFWPVAIYFFHKMNKISQEISRLKL